MDTKSVIENYKKYQLNSAINYSEYTDRLRQDFIKKFPKEKIGDLTLYDYMIAPKGYGQESSFCYMLRRDLQAVCSMGNAFPACFGVYLKKGTEIALNKTLENLFGSNFNAAFEYQKSQMVKLINAEDNDDYQAIDDVNINSLLKHKLLSVYYPQKYIPVCADKILSEYCERIGLKLPSGLSMVQRNLKLVEFRDSIPEIADWNNSVIMSFCVYLIKNNIKIDGNELRH